MIEVTLYSQVNCQLCEQAKADLNALQEQYPHQLIEFDIDSQSNLKRMYGDLIPVVRIGPYTLKAPFDRQELQITLMAAQNRATHIETIRQTGPAAPASTTWSRADRISFFFSRHYMAFFNLFVVIYVGLPFLAALMMKENVRQPAQIIYRTYSFVCHQLPYRSFFLFGEQAVYPRSEAGMTGLLTFQQASGMSESSDANDMLAAREFIGSPIMGYKIALCQRDVAIYLAILLFGILFAVTGHRLPAIPWYIWLVFGILPIGLDGLSQLVSQPPISLIPFRESTPYLRVITGGLFGFLTAWFGYPIVEETMAETRQTLAWRQQYIKEKQSSNREVEYSQMGSSE